MNMIILEMNLHTSSLVCQLKDGGLGFRQTFGIPIPITFDIDQATWNLQEIWSQIVPSQSNGIQQPEIKYKEITGSWAMSETRKLRGHSLFWKAAITEKKCDLSF